MLSYVFSSVFSYIYRQPINDIIDFFINIVVMWAVLVYLGRERARMKWLSRIGTAAALYAIVYATVLNRRVGSCTEVFLQPFSSLTPERYSDALFRQMVMNVFLFLPLGIFLPFALPEKIRHKALAAILFGLGLSASVETLQYVFHMGWCETDDVMMNTLGTAIGSCSYLFFECIIVLADTFRSQKQSKLLPEKIQN